MVKKKRNSKNTISGITGDDYGQVDSTSRSFIYDENDDFNELSDGESASDEADPFNADDSDVENDEEVLGLNSSTSEDSEEEDIGPMDIDDIHSDADDSDGHDERGLGRRKTDFFGTDLTDQRIHKASKLKNKAKEEDALLLEEESVKRLQERMAKQSIGLAQSDLIPHIGEDKPPELNILTHRKKKILDPKHAQLSDDELNSISAHVKDVTTELQDLLSPLIKARKDELLSLSPFAEEYLLTRYFLSLNYLNTVSAYMMVVSSDSFSDEHPCIMRYEQFRHLLKELEPCRPKYDCELTDALSNAKTSKKSVPRRKMLSVVKGSSKQALTKTKKDSKVASAVKEMQVAENEDDFASNQLSSPSDEGDSDEGSQIDDDSSAQPAPEDDRRLITYEIKKNKGLLPYRKKDQRNPRVKYKHKYQNKLKRRKGQVREVRKEITKYMGEVSGINRNAVKSVKLK